MKKILLVILLGASLISGAYASSGCNITKLLNDKSISKEVKQKIVKRHHQYIDDLYKLRKQHENKVYKEQLNRVETRHKQHLQDMRSRYDEQRRLDYKNESAVNNFRRHHSHKHQQRKCHGDLRNCIEQSDFGHKIKRIHKDFEYKKDRLNDDFQSDIAKLLKV